MYSKSRLIRVFSEENDLKGWKKLSVACKEESFLFTQQESHKFILEQRLENTEQKGRVRFSKLVEIFEFCKIRPNKISKLDELTSIAMDLKKNCGLIETILKPSKNRFRKPEIKNDTSKVYCISLRNRRESENGETIRPRTQFSQPLKVKNLTNALDLAKKIKHKSAKNLIGIRPKLLKRNTFMAFK